MSIQALSWVLENSRSSGNARCVLFSIANHANREGAEAFPELDTIALESNCSRATVKRALVELRNLDELDWLSGVGRAKSNYYWLPKMRMALGVPASPLMAQSEPFSLVDNSEKRAQIGTKKGSNQTRKGLNVEPRTKSNQKQPKTGARAEHKTDSEDGPADPQHIASLLAETKRKLAMKKQAG